MYFIIKTVNNIYERMCNIMNESNELILHVYQDAEMACFTLDQLINDLKEKDNKIKKILEDIFKEYETWKQKTKRILQKENEEISQNPLIAKIMAGQSIKKEVKNDNSDSAIADLLIKGISMGTIDMDKKIRAYQEEASKDDLQIAKDFLKFQEKTIAHLKEYL